MTAKDGHQQPTATRRLIVADVWGVVGMLGLLLTGCNSPYWNQQRPSVQQLMQDAIVESYRARVEQQSIVNERDAFVAHSGHRGTPQQAAGKEVVLAAHEQALPESLPKPPRHAGPRINEEFFETELREAIGILAEEADVDVIIDEQVGGVVNAKIRDATFEQALTKLLLPFGAVFGKREGQYIVCEPDPASPLFPFVSTHLEYRPKYLNAQDLQEAPPEPMRQFVRLIEPANVLVIDAPTQFVDVIVERIRALDQPVPQVELEAIVCVVEPDSGFRFGVDWSHAVELDGETAFNTGLAGLGISGQVSGRGINELFSDFSTTSAFVEALAENGYVSIRAAPRVIAEHGKKANITIGRETFFALTPTGPNGNSAVFFQQEIEKVIAGIELEITPYVRDSDVTVQIAKAEVSENIQTSTADIGANQFPIINRRSVSTTVHVEDGKTIIIGGLVQQEVIDSLSKVPGLSRLPGLGYLFKSVEHQQREAEVVIFISPRIVRPAGCPDCGARAPEPLIHPSPP